jgi:hypothetical protein
VASRPEVSAITARARNRLAGEFSDPSEKADRISRSRRRKLQEFFCSARQPFTKQVEVTALNGSPVGYFMRRAHPSLNGGGSQCDANRRESWIVAFTGRSLWPSDGGRREAAAEKMATFSDRLDHQKYGHYADTKNMPPNSTNVSICFPW